MAIDFPGVDEYIDCGSGGTLDDLNQKTVAFWANFDTLDTTHYTAVQKMGVSIGWRLAAYNDGAGLANILLFLQYFNGASDGQWRSATSAISTGSWQHVALSYDKTATTNDPVIYVNGTSVTVTELNTPVGTADAEAATNLILGAYSDGSNPLDGRMEDVRIFNRILSAQEIAVLAGGYRGPLGGEVGWWMMDTADAVAHWDGANLTVNTNYIPDLSGNANTGNPTGTPLGIGSTCPRMSTWLPRAIYNFIKSVSCAGAMAWTGVVSKATSKILAGAQTNTGTVAKLMLLQRTVMTGAMTWTGTLTKKTIKVLAGIIQWVGTLVGVGTKEVFVVAAADSLTVHADQGSLTFKCPPDDLTMRGLED